MAKALGLEAIGWHAMTENWWNLVIALLALICLILGAAHVLYQVLLRFRQHRQARKDGLARIPPPALVEFLANLPDDIRLTLPQSRSSKPATSFGVFLGAFANPPYEFRSPKQTQLLEQWDLIILDPYQPGVVEAAAGSPSPYVVGRLDVSEFDCTKGVADKPTDAVEVLTEFFRRLTTDFRRSSESSLPFTGILLANWRFQLPPVRLNPLLECLQRLHVEVYLEVAPPDYLSAAECRAIELEHVKGIVCQNATIFPGGASKDYFQMTDMIRVQRAFAKNAWAGGTSFMTMEVLEDEVKPSHSVLKRTFNWSRYNSALPWIGPRAALMDADAAAEMTHRKEPLGALMWLKTAEVMEVHNRWRNNWRISKAETGSEESLSTLASIVPNLRQQLQTQSQEEPRKERTSEQRVVNADFNWSSEDLRLEDDPLSVSAAGESYTGLGCFQTGLHCTSVDFDGLVEGQRRLRDLNLLDQLQTNDLKVMAKSIRKMYYDCIRLDSTTPFTLAIKDLLSLLENDDASAEKLNSIRVYVGMQSGFNSGPDNHFWGLYDRSDADLHLDIFISAKAADRTSTLLHTFLSSRDFPRRTCLEAECMLARYTKSMVPEWALPARLVEDIKQLTPSENLLLVRRLRNCPLKAQRDMDSKVAACCSSQLLDVPSLNQLRQMNTEDYLNGKVTAEQLIDCRLAWLRGQDVSTPSTAAALAIFQEFEARLPGILIRNEKEHLDTILGVLEQRLQCDEIDARTDIVALSIFCAVRKLAVAEVYLEVLDRNPMPNSHSDQAACFAEMFALGSQCEAYLDMTPKAVGRVLAERYWAYYKENQPPSRDDKATELPTTYASMNTDEDPSATTSALSFYYRLAFLGLFAVPALIDIVLLTLVGRGLYLSTYMAAEEKTMATAGLMFGLLLVGAIGTWVGHGGSYYLHSMAFGAMNMFVLTRLIAGLAICLGVGTGALIVIGCIRTFYAGFIFLFYFAALSTYLTLLATLAVYQFPGFSFQSGRTIVVKCIPILFISPIVTAWAGNDIIVYPVVLSGFLIILCFAARHVFAQWHSWYARVPIVSDSELVYWYRSFSKAGNPDFADTVTTDLAATPLPRTALMKEVNKERNRHFWSKSTADGFVKKVANGHDGTLLLMDWYCKYSRTKMPYPYSPTWNLQVKAGVDTLKDIQKGLKLHNAFIHWRESGPEVWCGVLYFVVALMDKWVALLTGGALVGLSLADSELYRLSVGFGLAYYLLAAVFLDAVATPLWPIANKKTSTPISSLEALHEVAEIDSKEKRKLYWTKLMEFFLMHVWGVVVAATLIWVFEGGRDAIIMFLLYMFAYTGLLWYQFSRIWTGANAIGDLMTGAVVGLVLGLILRTQTDLQFSGVLGLAAGTWTTAILAIITAIARESPKNTAVDETAPNFYCSGLLWSSPQLSQRTLSGIYERTTRVPEDECWKVTTTAPPGIEAMQTLSNAMSLPVPDVIQAAFPRGSEHVKSTIDLWNNSDIKVELVPARLVFDQDPLITSIVRDAGGVLHIIVFVGKQLDTEKRMVDVSNTSQIIAEAVLQAVAQTKLGFTYHESALTKLLVTPAVDGSISIPRGVKHHIEWSAAERAKIARTGERAILRHLLLDTEADDSWDTLPASVRSFLLKRCCGEMCNMDGETRDWMLQNLPSKDLGPRPLSDVSTLKSQVARCNLGAMLALQITQYAREVQSDLGAQGLADVSDYQRLPGASHARVLQNSKSNVSNQLLRPFVRVVQSVRFAVKFFIVCTVADPEVQRELAHAVDGKNFLLRGTAKTVLLSTWEFCHVLQRSIVPWFLLHDRKAVQSLCRDMEGSILTIKKKKVTIEGMVGPSTGFFSTQASEDGMLRSMAGSRFSRAGEKIVLHLFAGRHEAKPEEETKLSQVNTYSRKMQLNRREQYSNGKLVNLFQYEYATLGQSPIPIQRRCVQGRKAGEVVQYDERGCVSTGSYIKDGNLATFTLHYRRGATFDDELLRASFEFAHIQMAVAWCFPPSDKPEQLDLWLPYSKVTQATFIQGDEVYHSVWTYDHRVHPVIDTTLNGEPVETPPMIQYDWFGVLKKPTDCSFLTENPLFSFTSTKSNFLTRTLGLNRKRYPISTSAARTHLWKTWKQGKDLDAVTVRWLDEMCLRKERILRPYWRRRDLGLLSSAGDYLESNADAIMARSDVDPDVSAWCSISYKFSDLTDFGQGGDSKINTRKQDTQIQDGDEVLHVLAHDTGTWPNEGGGVSACRRDLVNNLQTIRWHVVAENANDFGTPKFQIERNVQSLSVLPLWGMDFLTPTHGIFQDFRDTAVQRRLHNVSDADIRDNFFPILESLVRCARATKFDRTHIEEASQALLDLNSYFASERHWGHVWLSDLVKQRWRELWLSEDVNNARPYSQWLEAEHPTLLHLDTALDMWHRYLFIFSLPLPERIPDVFQASHHFAGSAYGVLCKLRRNCSLHVWDHCISWREVTVFLSSAMSFDAPFVCSSLMQLSHMTSILVLHYADVVLPCADFFNPGWEVEHGTQEGVLQHRKAFARKIDPVVNGICDMEKFKPVEEIKTKTPTVVMLSHVRFVKDIKNAILAADIIVNEWGFKDYKLDIYGDMEKAPAYSVECKEILASKGLRDYVTLRGLGSPSKVLEEAWLFLNSSISEGLPLAMGEAALTGCPVVCTDVGASFRVVTDPVTWKKFSAVVAPNDSYSLAQAQLSVLALLGEWSEFADDEPGTEVPKLSLQPTPEDVAAITKRMYDKTEQRRRLGMTGRANVLNSFSEGRYLREHEQMLWVGKQQSPRYLSRTRNLAAEAGSYTAAHMAANMSMTTRADTPISSIRFLKFESPSPKYSAALSTASTSWSGS